MKKLFSSNLVVLACSIIVCIALLEVLLRLYDPFGFRVSGHTIVLPKHKRYAFSNHSCDKLEKNIIHTKNSLGFRGPELPPDFKDTLSLLAVGGSTTECLLLSDRHDWPYLTGKKLKPQFHNIWINNAGLDGHSTYGHYLLVKNCIAALKPKAVLFLIGTNDTDPYSAHFHDLSLLKKNTIKIVAACTQKMVRGVLSGKLNRTLNALYYLSLHMAEQSQVAACLLNLYRAHKARRQGLQHRCIDFASLAYCTVTKEDREAKIKLYSSRIVPKFYKRLVRLLRVTKKAGIYPVLITQPAMYGSGIDPDTGVDMDRVKCCGHNGLLQWELLELLNDVTRDIARTEKTALIDLARTMPRRSAYFYDFIHFTSEGANVVAGIIAADLRPSLEKQFPGYAKTLSLQKRATGHSPFE